MTEQQLDNVAGGQLVEVEVNGNNIPVSVNAAAPINVGVLSGPQGAVAVANPGRQGTVVDR